MTKIVASATLAATIMPLLSRHIRQPVLVGKHDINYSRHIDQNPKDEGNDTTVPSLLFGENIVPTASGYKSVAFIDAVPAYDPADIDIKHIALSSHVTDEDYYNPYIIIAFTKAANPTFIYFAHVSAMDYYNLGGSYEWQMEYSIDIGVDMLALPVTAFTSAYLKDTLYLFIAKAAIIEITAPGGSIGHLTPYTGLGLNINTLGICTSSGYLIAWNKETIQWSALEDAIDFVPSDVTGAGEGAIIDLDGEIKFCKATQNGFIVYGDRNAVFAQASNDFRFPFIFKPLPYLVGIADSNDVSYGKSLEHIVKSGSAIYRAVKAQVQPAFQDFYTFIAVKKVERFENSRLVEYDLDNTDVMFTVVDGSATVLSYKSQAAEQYDYALIDFLALGRQGKVKVDHKFVITWPFDVISKSMLVSDLGSTLVSDLDDSLVSDLVDNQVVTEGINVICFVAKNGSMKLMLDTASQIADGTLILGPFQLTRELMAELTRVEIATADAANITCKVLTSLTGEEVAFDTTLPAIQLGKKVRYDARVTGLNHSICLQGAFDLSSVLLELVARARR